MIYHINTLSKPPSVINKLTELIFKLQLPMREMGRMRGAFQKLKTGWPIKIDHKHDPFSDKEVRYQVGQERLELLRKNAQDFAYAVENGDEHVAFLHKLDEGDQDYRMPETTKFEYICGGIKGDRFILFSYIWFDSLSDAKNYALKHGMKILGGWHEE